MNRPPRCWKRRCKHYIGVVRQVEEDESSEVPVCKAFPEGIPNDIAYGIDPHLEVHIFQDNTVTYKMKKKKTT